MSKKQTKTWKVDALSQQPGDHTIRVLQPYKATQPFAVMVCLDCNYVGLMGGPGLERQTIRPGDPEVRHSWMMGGLRQCTTGGTHSGESTDFAKRLLGGSEDDGGGGSK